MSPIAYSLDELVSALNALRSDDERLIEFRDRTVKMLVANPHNKGWINEALWLVKMPVQNSGVWGSPSPMYRGIADYNGGGPEDDFSFERAVRLHEELG